MKECAMGVSVTLQKIGARIQAERKARNLSREKLAERVGMAEGSIQRIEGGKGCHVATLLQVCEALGISPGYLLSSTWTPPQKVPKLAPYQLLILEALIEGGTHEEIAERLGSSRPAVASVVSRIYTVLGVVRSPFYERRTEAIRRAYKFGLVKPKETNGQPV